MIQGLEHKQKNLLLGMRTGLKKRNCEGVNKSATVKEDKGFLGPTE